MDRSRERYELVSLVVAFLSLFDLPDGNDRDEEVDRSFGVFRERNSTLFHYVSFLPRCMFLSQSLVLYCTPSSPCPFLFSCTLRAFLYTSRACRAIMFILMPMPYAYVFMT